MATAAMPRRITTTPSTTAIGSTGNDICIDNDEEFLTNLTLDGVKEGPYMLCKHADDLLGHHARQVFREKASSMRGENSIYFYLKDIMKKFSSQQNSAKKKLSAGLEQLVLEAHEFRKLVASDPAFQCAIPSEQVDALFHRIEQDHRNVIRHSDFLEFCLLDQSQLRLLLFKYRKCLRKLHLADNEIADLFKRLSNIDSSILSPDLFHAAITRELDVVLTTGELGFMMQLMDYDNDGTVKVNDLEMFIKDDKASVALVHPSKENGVVDLKVSISEADDINLRREGYTQLRPKLQDDSNNGRMTLWFRTAPREEGKPAISSIKYASSSRDTELVSRGYTCLQQDLNRNGAFGKHKYIWMSYVPPNIQSMSEVIDLSLTCGDLDDTNDAKLWLPRHRGFKLIPGNLNEKTPKRSVFLWLRHRRVISAEDLVDPHLDQAPESPRATSNLQSHIDRVEEQVRKTLRRNCPIDQDNALNFGRLFDEFDPRQTRGISRQAFLVGIETFGIKMHKKDIPLVWERMNPFGKKQIDVATFSQFLELTESELDDVVNTLLRSMTNRLSYQIPNYRLIFQSYNASGDGRLNRSDFQRLFASNQLNFTNTELSKVMQRFDVNKDGVVDYTDFLRYITGICDAAVRTATRVADAAEEIRVWATEKQNKKLAKDGNIDSTAAWQLLKPKRGEIEISMIDHILRQRRVRLDATSLCLLKVLMAPATNGRVNQAAFHTFVNHYPKKISAMVYNLKKIVGIPPSESSTDSVFDRLNIEGNGKLSLVNFTREVNALAVEKGVNAIDLKDFVYVVQWTGANCGGDGAILIDRFLASIRETQERRNMKNEFITHYDSPRFLEGVNLLREEIKRCAKTPDGKFNFLIPFRLFDKDNSGHVMLSEFEIAIRELGVDKYLTDQEIKSLMRRFHLNSSGAIDYDEFLRFNLAESSSSARNLLSMTTVTNSNIHSVLSDIIANERLTPANAGAYCASMKRMFGIIDQETTGMVSVERFVEILKDMGVDLPSSDMDILVKEFSGSDQNSRDVQYMVFCDALLVACERKDQGQLIIRQAPSETLDLLKSLFHEYNQVRRKAIAAGLPEFDFYQALGAERNDTTCHALSVDNLKEILWAAGVRYPYLREELEAILNCFQCNHASEFSLEFFCKFLSNGPNVLFDANIGALDVYVTRLQDELKLYLATGNTEERLFSLFSEYDRDSNGHISLNEFATVLEKSGLRHFLSSDDLKLLLKFLDINNDGVIAYSEFVDFAKHADSRLNAAVSTEANALPSAGTTSPAKSLLQSPPKPLILPEKLSPVICRIWKLNQKLRPVFPFEKYFRKYKLKQNESRVKIRVFEKVLNKFLSRLLEQQVPYNMKAMDVDLLTEHYTEADGTNGVVNYTAFIRDLTKAEAVVADEKSEISSDASSSSDDEELSCSSDDDERPAKSTASALDAILGIAIKSVYKTEAELERLREQLKAVRIEMERKHWNKVSEKKMYKVLTTLGIRLRKKDVDLVFAPFATVQHGRELYDVKRFLRVVEDHAVRNTSTGNSELPTKQSTSKTLPTATLEKIYQCFLAAAQQNISGRKLLEKCDVGRTGKVTLLEFQTVLRLMGCALTDIEMVEVKETLGDDKSSDIDYSRLVAQMAILQQTQQDPHRSRQAQQVMRSRELGNFIEKRTFTSAMPVSAHEVSKNLCREQVSRYPAYQVQTRPIKSPFDKNQNGDSFLRQFFSDLLHTREIHSDMLFQTFAAYDIKGTGFISIDAFNAVMRKLDIWLHDDLATTVFDRFTTISSEKFDYVEFCQVINPPRSIGTVPLGAGNRLNPLLVNSNSSSSGSRYVPQRSKQELMMDTEAYFGQSPRSAREERKEKKEIFSLPLIDVEQNGKSEDYRWPCAPATINAPQSSQWCCPVCFHTQTKPTPTCEICAAQNPASVENELLVNCCACGFRNRPEASDCDLCGLSLHTNFSSAPTAAPLQSPKKLQLKIANAVPYDEGWIT